MNCSSCGGKLPEAARFCPSCGVRAISIPGQSSTIDSDSPRVARLDSEHPPAVTSPEFADKLLDCYLSFSLSKELAEWLRELGQTTMGTLEDKFARIRESVKAGSSVSESPQRQTIYYLSQYDADILSEICQELGVPTDGAKEELLRRIYYVIGRREGWLQPLSDDARTLIRQTLVPILKSFDYEKEYYREFLEDMAELVGQDNVHIQPNLAHGSAFVVLVIPELLQEAQVSLFKEELRNKGVDLF
jgi:hypothetical protein